MSYSKAELANMSAEQKKALVKQLLQKRKQHTPTPGGAAPVQGNKTVRKAEHIYFDQYPEYRQLQAQKQALADQQVSNPYFKPHETVSNSYLSIDGRSYVNFSGYNYLGLSGHPDVTEAAKNAIDQYGTSVSASRIASGEIRLHLQLESALADLLGTEACLAFVSGYATNVTTIGHLFGPRDLILHDELIHNSALLGCQLSGARRIPFPHNDHEALDKILERERDHFERVLIVLEGVYSMDGDIPDLPAFIDIKSRHQAFLMVDEAHSIGVLGARGRGIREHFDLQARDVDLWMGTLSKALASCGGYIAGSEAVIEYLKYTAPGFLYSVGISPANAAATLAAIQVMDAEPERISTLHEMADHFLQLAKEAGLNTGTSKDSAVVPVIIGDSQKCLRLSEVLFEQGINVQPVLHPAVEEGDSRLRFFISCEHTKEQISSTVNAVRDSLREMSA